MLSGFATNTKSDEHMCLFLHTHLSIFEKCEENSDCPYLINTAYGDAQKWPCRVICAINSVHPYWKLRLFIDVNLKKNHLGSHLQVVNILRIPFIHNASSGRCEIEYGEDKFMVPATSKTLCEDTTNTKRLCTI